MGIIKVNFVQMVDRMNVNPTTTQFVRCSSYEHDEPVYMYNLQLFTFIGFQVFQSIGKADKTKDETFDEHVANLTKQAVCIVHSDTSSQNLKIRVLELLKFPFYAVYSWYLRLMKH